eukprot:3801855-Prorocentrum_lima.AAC.1
MLRAARNAKEERAAMSLRESQTVGQIEARAEEEVRAARERYRAPPGGEKPPGRGSRWWW